MSGHAAGQRLEDVRAGAQGVIVTEPGEAEPREAESTAEDHAAAGHAAGSSSDDDVAGERYGVAQARALLRRFREDTGRDPETASELAELMIRRNAGALALPGQGDPSTG
jgi:hypothetical protein